MFSFIIYQVSLEHLLPADRLLNYLSKYAPYTCFFKALPTRLIASLYLLCAYMLRQITFPFHHRFVYPLASLCRIYSVHVREA